MSTRDISYMTTEVSCLAADSLESDSLASAFDDDEPSPFSLDAAGVEITKDSGVSRSSRTQMIANFILSHLQFKRWRVLMNFC